MVEKGTVVVGAVGAGISSDGGIKAVVPFLGSAVNHRVMLLGERVGTALASIADGSDTTVHCPLRRLSVVNRVTL